MGGEEKGPVEDSEAGKQEVAVPKVQLQFLNAPWWVLLLQGLIILVIGIVALGYPDIAIRVFIMLVGAIVLIQGIFAIIGGLMVKDEDPMWVLLLIGGVVSVVLGAIALFWPDAVKTILVVLWGFWALIVGTIMLLYAIKVRRQKVAGAGIQMVLGVIGIVIGLIAIIWHDSFADFVVRIIGLFAILFGIVFMVLAFRVRSQQQ